MKRASLLCAICAKRGVGAELAMPCSGTPAHLAEISAAGAPGADAVLVLDRAGWHMSATLETPHNITLGPPPPRSPKLNPVETI
ncbi:MAG: hypothetical protein AAF565_05210 [Pseudomonadota bacterium]